MPWMVSPGRKCSTLEHSSKLYVWSDSHKCTDLKCTNRSMQFATHQGFILLQFCRRFLLLACFSLTVLAVSLCETNLDAARYSFIISIIFKGHLKKYYPLNRCIHIFEVSILVTEDGSQFFPLRCNSSEYLHRKQTICCCRWVQVVHLMKLILRERKVSLDICC